MNRKEILERICEACESVENVDEVWKNVEPELIDIINNLEYIVKEIRDKLDIESIAEILNIEEAYDLSHKLADDLY